MKSKKKNFIEKIINFLLNILIIIFGVILLISVYTGVQTKILGNNYTDFFGYSIFEVQTGSMADAINAGDWIIVKLTQKVKLNDVITYELDGEYITHRVIEVYSGTYITKGDANNAKDEPIDQKQVVGKVVNVLANFGIIRKTLFNPSVLIALIITLFLINLTYKKNKNEAVKSNSNKEETIYLLLDGIAKKLSLFIKKIKKLSNNKKGIQSNNKHKAERKNFEDQKKSYDFKEFSENKYKQLPPKKETEEFYKDEDELDKTSFYRVVSVDGNEVDDKFKNVPTKAQIEEYYKDEDELDKTSFYRVISVDASEVDNTFLEIAKNELNESEQQAKTKEKINTTAIKQEKEEVEEESTLTKINLDILKDKKSNKKSENIIDTVIVIKETELDEIINILVKDDKTYINKATIKKMFMTTYIDAKYYNYYGDRGIEASGKNSISKSEKVIKLVANELKKDYHGNDTKYNDIVEKYCNIFIVIANLEQAKDLITDSKAKNEFYKKELKKYSKDWEDFKIDHVIEKIMETQESYSDALESYMEKLDTNMFNLSFNKLETKKDIYALELEHNVSFSKVFSDYIIDKTYSEGIVAEDKMSVLLTLLSVQLIKDMFLSNFNKKYVMYVPASLYDKEKKFAKLLRIIDDKYAKDNVVMLITYEDLISNKKIVKEVKKMGYRFALVFNKESTITEKDRGYIYVADYIFINKKIVNTDKILPFIPEDILDRVIYEDIIEKVGDFEGDQV